LNKLRLVEKCIYNSGKRRRIFPEDLSSGTAQQDGILISVSGFLFHDPDY